VKLWRSRPVLAAYIAAVLTVLAINFILEACWHKLMNRIGGLLP